MGLFAMGVPAQLTEILKKKYGVKVFIETGTYSGGTALWAAQRFEKVITIENSKPIYEKTSQAHKDKTNISFLYGNSKEQLLAVTESLTETAIFWLDAHWSGGETFGVEDECPILEEIDIINRSPYPHSILIDDARLFMKPPPLPHKAEQWADISQVINKLNEIKNRYCFIADDVIGAVPDEAKNDLWPYFEVVIKSEQSLMPAGKASLVTKIKSKLKI